MNSISVNPRVKQTARYLTVTAAKQLLADKGYSSNEVNDYVHDWGVKDITVARDYVLSVYHDMAELPALYDRGLIIRDQHHIDMIKAILDTNQLLHCH
jgi:hypothetical protein